MKRKMNIVLFSVILLSACNVHQFCRINIPYESMACYSNGHIIQTQPKDCKNGKLLLIKYIGPQSCSFCEMIKLPDFDDVWDLLGRDNVNCCCIISTKDSLPSIIRCLNQNYLSFPCYIDDSGNLIISGCNHAKGDSFLIDSDSNILFQGDLLNSSFDRKVAQRIINQYIKPCVSGKSSGRFI